MAHATWGPLSKTVRTSRCFRKTDFYFFLFRSVKLLQIKVANDSESSANCENNKIWLLYTITLRSLLCDKTKLRIWWNLITSQLVKDVWQSMQCTLQNNLNVKRFKFKWNKCWFFQSLESTEQNVCEGWMSSVLSNCCCFTGLKPSKAKEKSKSFSLCSSWTLHRLPAFLMEQLPANFSFWDCSWIPSLWDHCRMMLIQPQGTVRKTDCLTCRLLPVCQEAFWCVTQA